MMKIDPVGGTGAVPSGGRNTRTSNEIPKHPTDSAELGQSRQAARGDVSATYSRAEVAAVAAEAKNVETQMTSDARASRLAAIEKRVGEGAYNAREIIERVADRLLEEWGLGARITPPRPE